MTKEQINISARNKCLAQKYFGIDKMPPYTYDLHHINPELKHTDVERYIQWNPEDLVVLTHAEHTRLHKKGISLSEEHKRKIGDANRGRYLGTHQSEESKIKRSDSLKSFFDNNPDARANLSEKFHKLKWFNNGQINKRSEVCPDGFVPGRIPWK